MIAKAPDDAKLTINVSQMADRIVTLEICGELTRLAEKPLEHAYAQAVNLGAKTIILECSNLKYMNHKGVSLLVKLVAIAQSDKRKLVAVGLSNHYRRVFQISGLDEGIPVFADMAQVVGTSQGL